MRKAVLLVGLLALAASGIGCNSKGGNQSAPESSVAKDAGAVSDKDLALEFLQGIQEGDRQKVYEAANLTTGIVDESREKLVHSSQSKLTDKQRKIFEHTLRTSGNVDFFVKKLVKILPKSARFQITESKVLTSNAETRQVVHFVKITYGSRGEAMTDKKGMPVKEMVVHLQQDSRSADGRWIHDFSFSSNELDKIADKDFEVVSYF